MSTDSPPTLPNARPVPRPLARLAWLSGAALATVVTAAFVLLQGLTIKGGDGTLEAGVEIGSWVSLALPLWLGLFLVGIRPWRLFIAPDPAPSQRQWRGSVSRGDRLRVWWTVLRYDFWLDWYDTPRGTRGPARRELRANLQAATEESGAARAVADLGDVRLLAEGIAEGLRTRPTARLNLGIVVALVAFLVLWIMWIFTIFGFADGAMATADSGTASGTVFPWASEVTVEWSDDGLSVESEAPWVLAVAPLLCFVVVGRPWRLLTRRR